MEPQTGGVRINKVLSTAGVCSRREADVLVSQGRVRIDGKAAMPGDKVNPGSRVTLDGKPVGQGDSPVLLLFYKPRGLVCSTKRQRSETTVVDYIHYPVRIYPVGRLDKDSEGLLLMTNQGEISEKILRGSNYHEKEYRVRIDRPVTSEFLMKMAEGVPILETVTRPCRTWQTGKDSFGIILTQGLNRQIRRMCHVLGAEVLSLKRIRIMNLTLEGLRPGQYRPVGDEEYRELLRLLDGRQQG